MPFFREPKSIVLEHSLSHSELSECYVERSVSQPTDQTKSPSTRRQFDPSVSQPMSQSNYRPVNLWASQPMGQPNYGPVNLSACQPAGQSITQSIRQQDNLSMS
jgi:hypothetical protein